MTKKFEITDMVVVRDDKVTLIRSMVKIGELTFTFNSSSIDSPSDLKYCNFACKDTLLKGACKVVGIEEEALVDELKKEALPMIKEEIKAITEAKVKAQLEWWKNLEYWTFIEEFKKQLPEGCTANHMSYERGIELINEDRLGRSDSFPTINVVTPYSQRSIQIEYKQAYSGSTYYSKPSYVYWDITCGYDEKFGKPRKKENIITKVLQAINTLKARDERRKNEVKKQEEYKKETLSELDDSFKVEEERKYSKTYRGKGYNWVDTKFVSEVVVARKNGDGTYNVVVKPKLSADQVNALNDYLKTIVKEVGDENQT